MSDEGFRPNWLAIWTLILGLIAVGWLLGVLAGKPDGKTIRCPEEDMIEVVRVGEGLLVYCEDY